MFYALYFIKNAKYKIHIKELLRKKLENYPYEKVKKTVRNIFSIESECYNIQTKMNAI